MQSDTQKNDYNAFRVFLQDACGILLGDNKEYLVNSRLKPVLEKYKLVSLSQLVEKLKHSRINGLKEEVVDAMTTNETLWFRDAHPFRILEDKLFSELGPKAGASPLKIWSAACSTGQEPYSIAITAEEYRLLHPGKLRGGVRVVATDISSTVLDLAKKGEYEMLALGRGMSEQRLRKFFKSSSEKKWQILPQIRSVVDFRTLNLLDNYAKLGTRFDIVFCRNVLIYFAPDHKKDILKRIHQVLKPGGYLLLGASESLNGLPDEYEMVQCRPGIIYRAK